MTIEELEGYFTGIELPEQITLETGVVIVDVPLFLASHFEYIKDNPTSKSIDVFIMRLHKAIAVIEAGDITEEINAVTPSSLIATSNVTEASSPTTAATDFAIPAIEAEKSTEN